MATLQVVCKAPPKVLPCTCVHEFQDKEYGRNKRLHNPTMVRFLREVATYRCTVCGNEQGV